MIARSRALDERRSGETGDLWLRGQLNRWRAHGEIHLSQTCGTRAGGAAFATETDENGLGAGGGDARRTRVRKAGNAAGGHGCAGPQYRIEQIDILRAEIGDDELRIVGSQGQAAQTDIRSRAAGRLKRSEKSILLKTENIEVIDVSYVDTLAALIVKQEPEKTNFRMRLNALEILERFS